MKKVIVYTQPVCKYCDILKFALINEDIDFEVRDIENNEEFRAELDATGFQGTPVTVVGDKSFYGVATEEIKKALQE